MGVRRASTCAVSRSGLVSSLSFSSMQEIGLPKNGREAMPSGSPSSG
jgi:hypothetical protein